MEILIYILRSILILIICWTGIRLIGKKSIAEMTGYEFSAIMLLTTVAAEPLVFKIVSKATVGVFTIVIATVVIGTLSLNKFFYNVDIRPSIVVFDGMINEKELKKMRMNIPLLMSELRIKGYQNVGDIKYAILEPTGKLSVVAKSQISPVTPKEMGLPTNPVNLSLPLILDGKVNDENLKFLQKDQNWLQNQLRAFGVGSFDDVLIAQYDSSGQLFVNKKGLDLKIPNIF